MQIWSLRILWILFELNVFWAFSNFCRLLPNVFLNYYYYLNFSPLGNRIFSFLTPLLVFLFLFARPCSLFLFPLFFCPKLLELSWTSHLTINYIIYNLGGKTLIFLSLLFFFTRVNYIIYLRYSMLVSLVVFTLA